MNFEILEGDVLNILPMLPDDHFQTCVTSPPYWGLRNYQNEDQLGLEKTFQEYIDNQVRVFRDVRRVLRPDGTLWLVMGDSYAGSWGNYGGGKRGQTGTQREALRGSQCHQKGWDGRERDRPPGSWTKNTGLKPKDLIGQPWALAFALRNDGWYLRADIIWAKPNPMPESVQGSHFTRHMVTIEEYERLSGLPYIDECAGSDWAGDMPSLSERKIFSRKAPLSKKSKGKNHCPSPRNATGCQRKAASIRQIMVVEKKQSEIRDHDKGQDHQGKSNREIQSESNIENQTSTSAPTNKGQSKKNTSTQNSELQIPENPQGKSLENEGICNKKTCNPSDEGFIDSRGMDTNPEGIEGTLFLLQEEKKINHRSCNSAEQGRPTHERECGSSMHSVQLKKEESDSEPLLVGCPGCEKCLKHHGYIFHLSAGRPTKSHEYIFLLSKSPSYFCDMDAIREPLADVSLQRISQPTFDMQGGGPKDPLNGGEGSPNRSGRKALENLKKRILAGWDTRADRSKDNNTPGLNTEEGRRLAKEGRNSRMHFDRDPAHKATRKKRKELQPDGHQRLATHREEFRAATGKHDGYFGNMRNKRTVWSIATQPFREAHFATFPEELAKTCILAGSRVGDLVLDPYNGSGTTGKVAVGIGRGYVGIEINPEYAEMSRRRIGGPLFAEVK